MTEAFLKWNDNNRKSLEDKGISIDNMLEAKETANVAVDYLSQVCFGRVSVWESGNVDMEILDIESEKVLFYKYYELSNSPNFGHLLKDFMETMQSGSQAI